MRLADLHRPCRRAVVATVFAAGVLVAPTPDAAAQDASRGRLLGGAFLQDRGPLSDRHEDGYALNLEYQFAPPDHEAWGWIGAPRPHVGAMLSLNGETSQIYAGVTYETGVFDRLFAALHAGLAAHDGPLHKDPQGCRERSDCGYGTRFAFRGAVEFGIRLSEDSRISVLWDHTSHANLLSSENEGLDHIGLRYGVDF